MKKVENDLAMKINKVGSDLAMRMKKVDIDLAIRMETQFAIKMKKIRN